MPAHQERSGGEPDGGQRASRPAPARSPGQGLPSVGLCGPADVLALQSAVGNRAVSRMLAAEEERQPGQAADQPRGEVPVQRVVARPGPQSDGSYKTGMWTEGNNFNGLERAGKVWMMSNGHDPVGSPPEVDPAGYSYIRQLGLTRFWVRFHLINQQAGGVGEALNLVPGSGSDNRIYEEDFESKLKEDVQKAEESGGYVFFAVEAEYPSAQGASEAGNDRRQDYAPFFPKSLKVDHHYLLAGAKEWVHRRDNVKFPLKDKPPSKSGIPRKIDMDDQPSDNGSSVRSITSIKPKDLKKFVSNSVKWNNDDVKFLESLGSVRKSEFESYLKGESLLGAKVNDVVDAFGRIPYRPQVRSGDALDSGSSDEDSVESFADRVDNKVALWDLAGVLVRGYITL